ncbi:MAG TPA: DNA primase [Rhodospirillales bacterium]|jgi:DNA primase|nr:DNA primase [Rhodospirillales bacterium]
MAFSSQFLDELRARLELAGTIARRVRLTKKGREHIGLCPFHKEKTPSFTVNEDKGFYHCFGCDAHGGVIDFVMQMDGLSFPEAVRYLAAEAGMEVPADTPEECQRNRHRQSLLDIQETACVYFEKMLRMPEGKAASYYLSGRGLDDDTIKRFRLGFAPDARGALKTALGGDGISEELLSDAGLVIRPDEGGRAPYDRFRRRVMFPITDAGGRIIAFGGRILSNGEPQQTGAKYLNSPETDLFQKGRVLYGLAQAKAAARKSGRLIVTEGYMDVIALAQAGYQETVAPLGTALTEDQIGILWRLVREPVLCFDPDAAGQRAAARAAERTLPLLKPGYGLRFAFLRTDTGDDPDGVSRRYPRQFMDRTVADALSLSDMLWRMEAGTGSVKTPEQRAALQKKLQDHARRINDPTVRAHFLRSFKERIWQMGKGRRMPAVRIDPGTVSASPVGGDRIAQRTLIAIIINHPDFFPNVEEQFGCMHFDDESLDRLRQELVMMLSGNCQYDAESVKEELGRRGLSESIDSLYSDASLRRHRMIGPRATNGDIRASWDDSLRYLRKMAFAAETDKQISAKGFSDEELRRIVELKRAQLGEAES